MADPVFIVDTREQLPYEFDHMTRAALATGDYAIEGYEDVAVVERKALNDFIGSVTTNRARFMRELDRMAAIAHPLIVVEGSWYHIEQGLYVSKAHPNSIIGTMMSIMVDRKIPIVMAGGRVRGQRITERWLRRAMIAFDRAEPDRALEELAETPAPLMASEE